MRKKLAALAALVIAGLLLTAQQRPAPRPGIQGVWRVVEQTINERTLKAPELGAGYHIFTAGHFAVVRESGNTPRPDLSSTDTPTAEQVLAVYGPFVALCGSYEISGDVLT